MVMLQRRAADVHCSVENHRSVDPIVMKTNTKGAHQRKYSIDGPGKKEKEKGERESRSNSNFPHTYYMCVSFISVLQAILCTIFAASVASNLVCNRISHCDFLADNLCYGYTRSSFDRRWWWRFQHRITASVETDLRRRKTRTIIHFRRNGCISI